MASVCDVYKDEYDDGNIIREEIFEVIKAFEDSVIRNDGIKMNLFFDICNHKPHLNLNNKAHVENLDAGLSKLQADGLLELNDIFISIKERGKKIIFNW